MSSRLQEPFGFTMPINCDTTADKQDVRKNNAGVLKKKNLRQADRTFDKVDKRETACMHSLTAIFIWSAGICLTSLKWHEATFIVPEDNGL